MDKAEAIKLAKDYKSLVSGYLEIKEMYLYGSYAKGNHHKESDIDIAIVVKKSSEDYFSETPLLWKLRRQISAFIEPILLDESDKNSPLYKQVIRHGISI